MGDTSPGDDATADPHHMWRRPAAGDGPPVDRPAIESTAPRASSIWEPGYEAPPRGSEPSVEQPAAPRPPDALEDPGTDPHAGWRPPRPPESAIEPAPVPVESLGGPRAGQTTAERHGAPTATDDRFGRWWPRVGVLVAVVVVAGTVVALASGRGDDTTSSATSMPPAAAPSTSAAPTSTTRRPFPTQPPTTAPTTVVVPGDGPDRNPAADVAPAADPRVLLVDLPQGVAPINAAWIDGSPGAGPGGLLFIGDGATWRDGPWVRVATEEYPQLVGPASSIEIAGSPAVSGRGADGADVVVVQGSRGDLAVSAKGLPADSAASVAAALERGATGTWSLPAAALPAGLHAASGALAAAFEPSPGPTGHVLYETPGGSTVRLFTSLAAGRPDPRDSAAFYLDDVAYVSIGGDPGVIGTFDFGGGTAQTVKWRRRGVDIEITAYGPDRTTILELAALARTRLDGEWHEQDWLDAAAGTPTSSAEPAVMVASGLAVDERRTIDVWARRTATEFSWWAEGRDALGVGRYGAPADATTPLLLDVTASSRDPFDDEPGYVVAIAVGDESLGGTTLRLRTGTAIDGTGTNGPALERAVNPIGDAEAPEGSAAATTTPPAPSTPDAAVLGGLGDAYGTAVAAEWSTGSFVAELIAADGVTVLATATEADLP